MRLVLLHFACRSLCRHEEGGVIYIEHPVDILGLIFHRGGDLKDAGGGEETIEAFSFGGDVIYELVQPSRVAHIDAMVAQRAAELEVCPTLDGEKIFCWLREAIKTVYYVDIAIS